MKIGAARIFVNDIQAAKEFYSQLGLSLENYDLESGICIFNTGETKLIVESVLPAAPKEDQILVGRFTGLSFQTNNIQKSYESLKSIGVEFSGVPEQQYWGGWLATLIDPANNEVQLVQESA